MNKAKIAIIMPVFNEQDRLVTAINSVFNQTFKDWVLIIINDGSTDNTSDVLKEYIFNPKIIIEHLSINGGVANARNIGLEWARIEQVEYVCWLDADDFYLDDKLESQYNFMESNKEFSLVSGAMAVLVNNQIVSVLAPYQNEISLNYSTLEDYKCIPSASCMIRLRDLSKNKFNRKLQYASDQDFLRRFLLNKKYAFICKIGYIYNRGHSFSIEKYKKSLELDLKSKKDFGFSRIKLFEKRLLNRGKYLFVCFLFKSNLSLLYFKLTGREIAEDEKVELYMKIDHYLFKEIDIYEKA